MADVLVIDDDIDSADVLADIMRAAGHEVSIGYNGQEGLELAKRHKPDLVLLDVEMPLLGGPDMAYEMLLHDMGLERVPVVFLSGVPNLTQVAARVGTPYFLAKPYRYATIMAIVERALAERIAPTHPAREPAQPA
jgi:DNA-binding NtrC family response regulator